MFNKEGSDSGIKEAETIIGQTVKVKGNFHGQGNIIIEGQVEGSVKTNAFLLVGEKAKITASIDAKEAKIAGEIVGNIDVNGFVEIKSTAKINGDIKATLLSVEKGAIINGHCQMGKEKVGNETK